MTIVFIICSLFVLGLYAILNKLYYLKPWVRVGSFSLIALFAMLASLPHFRDLVQSQADNDLLKEVDLEVEKEPGKAAPVKNEKLEAKKEVPLVAELKNGTTALSVSEAIADESNQLQEAHEIIAEIKALLTGKIKPEMSKIKQNMDYAKDPMSTFYVSNQKRLIELETLDDLLEVRISYVLKDIDYAQKKQISQDELGQRIKIYRSSKDSLMKKYY